jgi:OOP family OmpA-OmpF porin
MRPTSELPRDIVNFGSGSAALPPTAAHDLADVIAREPAAKNCSVLLMGYTDKTGSPQINLILSKRRSLAAAQFLIARGIDPSRIVVTAYGERERTTAAPHTAAKEDRRVEVQWNCRAPPAR